MLARNLARSSSGRRTSCRVNSPFHAAAFEEAQSKVRVLRIPESAFKQGLSVCEELSTGHDTAAIFLVPKLGATIASPSIDAVYFKSRISESIVIEDPAGRTWYGRG